MVNPPETRTGDSSVSLSPPHVRVLLLDDEPDNLFLRATILRQHGYDCVPASTIDEAIELFNSIDIAVLDYHLGAGQFGTEAATLLRRSRPYVPIIILSATLEHFFGGAEDMHLLKGHSSIEDILSALSSLEAKRRGAPVVVDARDFFYSRIAMAIGSDVLVQIFDSRSIWLYCNESAAGYFGQPRDWFPGRSPAIEMPTLMRDWREIVQTVSHTRETYIDRTHRGLLNTPKPDEQNITWSVLAFPITLHDDRSGVVLTARILDRSPAAFA
ncbi:MULTISPECIES: response regulator [Acidobacteriaceae]|uniref:response regulator n=1 Tax=Acidobacteriaceae TaxID=204434 RepID=UPI00131B995E|nr:MULTISPECIES: response regulator [Acidobacteriaceae]MDW5265309.1 response regulator [Edaphobacter sp.]